MGLELDYLPGQTPLDPDEKEGLRIKIITTRQELDEFEQLNIEKAYQKYMFSRKLKLDDILTEKFILQFHKDMLGDVWSWAGEFRQSNKNIGIDKTQISIQLRQLIDDCRYWIGNETYTHEEIAIRFSHRLVAIHVFPNGNGRHSRTMADIIMKHIFKKPVFSWGQGNLVDEGDMRTTYIKALQSADQHDIQPLLNFARS